VGVSPKTVERWLRDETIIPHPRNQADVCKALGAEEQVIWPKTVRATVKTGHDREVFAVYPYRSSCPATVWAELIQDAQEDIFLAGYTNYFVWLEQPALLQTLRHKAESGCRVRFLLGDPDCSTTRQREEIEDTALTVSTRIRISLEHLARLDGLVEVRFSAAEDGPNHVGLSVFRFDEQALVTPHLARVVGHDSPMMHLRRSESGGMFDRFSEHAEELWGRGRSVSPVGG
jgi:hypothetical protein